MKLFLFIALVAVIAAVLLSRQRSRTRIIRIEHRRRPEDADA
jgi:hypothetical protein